MITTIPKLPYIDFPGLETQYPEPARMRTLIDRYGDDPIFQEKHNEFIYWYLEALLRWLPEYKNGHSKPDVSCSLPERLGWSAYLRFQAVLAVDRGETFFWNLMLEHVHKDYLEQVLGLRVMADGSISRGKYISPKKYHQTTPMPSDRDGLNIDKLKTYLGRVTKTTGAPTEIGAFIELEYILWCEVSRSHDPEVRALRDEFQEWVTRCNATYRRGTAVPRTTFCPYCKKLFKWTPREGVSNTPVSCESLKCAKAVKRNNKRKQRNHSPSDRLLTGWEPDPDRPGRGTCRVCENRRKVDKNKNCQDCSRKAFFE
jgi:hypothetical protein